MLIERLQVIRKWKSLVPPAKVREVTSGYLDEQNPLKEWVAEYYLVTHWEGDQVSASEMRQNFMLTHPDSNMSAVKFKELMGFNGVEGKHTMAGKVFYGIKRRENTS